MTGKAKNMFRVRQARRSRGPSRASWQAGFTIVELMFVLAIASIILLLVLEALPGLERNGRNDSRRQDVQTILAAVSHYELSNSGDLPGVGSNFLQYSKLVAYDVTQVKYLVDPPGTGPLSAGINVYSESANVTPVTEQNANISTVNIYNFRKCDTGAPGSATNQGAGYNDIVALYGIETGSGSAPQCQQL